MSSADIDLDEICQYYSSSRGWEKPDDILYTKLEFKVVEGPEWSESGPSTAREGPTSVVTVERANPNLDAYGAVNHARKQEFLVRTQLHEGRLKGPKTQLSLPLPQELRKPLGDAMNIDLDKKDSETSKPFIIEAQSGQQFPQGKMEATAEVTSKDMEYTGHFRCTVKMKGPIRFQGIHKEQEIGEIVAFYNDRQRPCALEVLRREGKPKPRVEWVLKGYCEIRWMTTQKISWK